MKKMVIIMASVCALLLCSCSGNTSISYTYQLTTGDSVKVTLDTSEGYSLASEIPFTISCNGETLSQGMFITEDDYKQYVSVVTSDLSATILEQSSKDGNEYIFWSYNDSEYNYAIMIEGSDSAILLGNNVSEDSARACFERLEFSKK